MLENNSSNYGFFVYNIVGYVLFFHKLVKYLFN
jgi:hypothetical protein